MLLSKKHLVVVVDADPSTGSRTSVFDPVLRTLASVVQVRLLASKGFAFPRLVSPRTTRE
jgi:hypothetical protein